MQIEAAEDTNEAIERERAELHRLIDQRASNEDIQRQSEILDKHIASYYSLCV